MVCDSCKSEGNSQDCGTCIPLDTTVKVVNDVIYYIHYHSSRATFERIVEGCERNFLEPVIVEAKRVFLEVVLKELSFIDKPLATEVATARRGGNKSKAEMVITDIYKALIALGTAVEVKPDNEGNISMINPEFMCSESLVTRVRDSEVKLKEAEEKLQYHNVQIESLLDINRALRCLLNEMLNDAGIRVDGVGKISDARAAVDAAVAAATAVTITTAVANEAISVTPAPSSDDLESPSDNAAATSTEVDLSEPPPTAADAVEVITQPINDEESNDIPADQAAVSDTGLVPAADASNVVDESQDVAADHAGVSDADAVDVATPLPQLVTSIGHSSPGIVRETPKPMPRNISLKHQRNITAQRTAAETAAFAVTIGLTSEMAASLGTMAADCVAKNYGTKQQATRNKTYADSIKKLNGNAVKAPASKAAAGNVPQQKLPTIAVQNNRSNNNNKHKFNSTCITGTGSIAPNGSSLAYVKPVIPQNEVLVVAGIDKKVNNEKLQEHIDTQAGCHIQLINVIGLNRTINKSGYPNRSRTVALELSKEDYVQLSKSDFWEPTIKIWPFKGKHFWYLPKRHTQQEARNPVRDSWA